MYNHMLPLRCVLESRQANTPPGESSHHSAFPAAPSSSASWWAHTRHIPRMHCHTNGSSYLGSSTYTGLWSAGSCACGYWVLESLKVVPILFTLEKFLSHSALPASLLWPCCSAGSVCCLSDCWRAVSPSSVPVRIIHCPVMNPPGTALLSLLVFRHK